MIETFITDFSVIFAFTVLIFWPKFYSKGNIVLNNTPQKGLDLIIGLKIGLIGLTLGFLSLDSFNGGLYNSRIILILYGGIIGGPISILLSGFIMNFGRLFFFPVTDVGVVMTVNSMLQIIVIAIFAAKYRVRFDNIYLYLYFALLETSMVALFYFDFSMYSLKFIFIILLFTSITFWSIYMVLSQSQATSDQARQMMAMQQVDYLTQLPNNIAIEAHLNYTLSRSSTLSFLHIDIDQFKQYNNKYSYLVGDQILEEVAGVLKNYAYRKEAFVGRIGGQEFCYIINGGPPAVALYEANNLKNLIDNHVFGEKDGLSIHITISIGISSTPDNGVRLEQLYAAADTALQATKKTSSNQVYHYNQYLKDIQFSHL